MVTVYPGEVSRVIVDVNGLRLTFMNWPWQNGRERS